MTHPAIEKLTARIPALEAENARLRKIVAAVQIERMENWGQPMILHNTAHAISHKMECALCAALEEPEGGTNG